MFFFIRSVILWFFICISVTYKLNGDLNKCINFWNLIVFVLSAATESALQQIHSIESYESITGYFGDAGCEIWNSFDASAITNLMYAISWMKWTRNTQIKWCIMQMSDEASKGWYLIPHISSQNTIAFYMRLLYHGVSIFQKVFELFGIVWYFPFNCYNFYIDGRSSYPR